MSYFEIFGPNKLNGEIEVMGAKNAAMKIIAASVLIPDKIILENVPDILDINTIINILVQNGAEITRSNHTLDINTNNLLDENPNPKLVKKMRGSIVLVGPYLARYGKISIPQPGGCAIGARPIDIHLDAFKQFGVKIDEENGIFNFNLKDYLPARTIDLKGVSVTATENILMLAVTINGTTTINNAATEPEIQDLANFLVSAGAKISGIGTNQMVIEGVTQLNPINYKTCPDRIEAGTFAALSIVTKSPLKITNCNPHDLKSFLDKVAEIGVDFEIGDDFIQLKKFENLKAIHLETAPYPGFPTDLQAPMGLIMTQANGKSTISENIFENRLNYINELALMNVNAKILDAHRAEITGPNNLSGANIESLDLRAGATMILAGLIAHGKTTISNAEIVDRGYERIEERLQKIGAKIKRIK